MFVTVRLWNLEEKIITYTVPSMIGEKAFYFPDATPNKKNRILTYKIEVLDVEKKIVDRFVHTLWTDVIEFSSGSACSDEV
jgi:hypothetical protein